MRLRYTKPICDSREQGFIHRYIRARELQVEAKVQQMAEYARGLEKKVKLIEDGA